MIRRHISRRSRYASRFTPTHRDRSGRTSLDPTPSPTCCSSRSRCHLRYCAFGSFMLLVWVHALCRCPVAGCCIFQSIFSSSSGSGPPRRSRWRRVPRGSEPVHQTPAREFSMIGSISRAETCPALRVRAGVRALWPEASAAWPVMGDLVEQRRRARIVGDGCSASISQEEGACRIVRSAGRSRNPRRRARHPEGLPSQLRNCRASSASGRFLTPVAKSPRASVSGRRPRQPAAKSPSRYDPF